MNQWPGVKLRVIEGWDEEGQHSDHPLHYEGRAVDVTTSDRDRSKNGMLARLAVEAGFDWVYYESKTYIHCSVKSESSQAAKYGGCFSGKTMVQLSDGRRSKLSDLQVGERVLAWDSSARRFVFSEVLMFLDWDPMQRRQFLRLETASGRTLTVTPSHLVLVEHSSSNETGMVFAENLRIGNHLLVKDAVGDFLVKDRLVHVEPVLDIGVFAPLTSTGTIVVDSVVASCYAVIDSQAIAHWAFMPYRLASNARKGLYRLWYVVTRPISGWEEDVEDHATKPSSRGVHWYANTLYSVAKYVIPSRLVYN